MLSVLVDAIDRGRAAEQGVYGFGLFVDQADDRETFFIADLRRVGGDDGVAERMAET